MKFIEWNGRKERAGRAWEWFVIGYGRGHPPAAAPKEDELPAFIVFHLFPFLQLFNLISFPSTLSSTKNFHFNEERVDQWNCDWKEQWNWANAAQWKWKRVVGYRLARQPNTARRLRQFKQLIKNKPRLKQREIKGWVGWCELGNQP